MSATTPSFGPGGLTVTLDLGSGEGAVRARRVTIASSRPTGFSATLFAGRHGDDVPGLVGRLHALCGRSHAVAAEAAIAAAAGGDGAARVAGRFAALAAERLGEHLRSTFAGARLGADLADAEVLADVRSVLASARGLDGAGAGPGAQDEVRRAVDRIRHGLARLGLGIDRRGRFAARPGSWAAAMLGRVGPTSGDVFLPSDRLSADDDAAVIAALAADPAGFAARPHLAGRRPETGPAARAATGPATADGRERLASRLAEIAEAAELFDAPADHEARLFGAWVGGGRLDGRTGWAAVESPRGRLHHLARLDGEGRIAAYAILAPTEWNFHAEGPFAATLAVNHWGEGARDVERVERIASLFDPCVGFEVRVRGGAGA